MKIRIS